MIVLIWLILRILLLITIVLAIYYSIKLAEGSRTLQILKNGFKEGLKGSGMFFTKAPYPVELYKWVTSEDEDVCEDCKERANWPAMDIADWMKEGLPSTPESQTECGDNCRCRLELRERKRINNRHIS